MTMVLPITGLDASPVADLAAMRTTTPSTGFADVLMQGLRQLDARVATSEDLVRQFALDDSVPVHQVTIALEQSRLAVELAMQVRGRLLEGYRDVMAMQL